MNLVRNLIYPFKVLKQLIYLPGSVHNIKQNQIALELLSQDIELLKNNIANIHEQQNRSIDDILKIDKLVHKVDDKLVNINHIASNNQENKTNLNNSINNTIADNHNMDYFYKIFEDKFRGSEKDIKARILEYKPLFNSIDKNIKKLPTVDLGCGRGEFLSFAKDININAIGIDINHDMIQRSKRQGFNVFEIDAMNYILKQEANSLSAITGFHIVEHIPFDLLIKLFEECYRVISPGGFALFETPNPQNLNVGACSFYLDPSHIRPIPPELLSFALESVGFVTEIKKLHPEREITDSDDLLSNIAEKIYGPQDYAVIAKKI
ncbi:hypothetical protein CVV43_03520 [Candidatus Saccharibacteria bacterium HGW-Saccharibacteria-1]|jgi:SAM-dependent methyltransferase|nr:MAG: hypothetical protein CVV43_03520 [Candidatus Saccharibacteria bacterium HGW-Saccharibacteria-1]